eukprot:4373709-Pyramimonas_sp.AAC.1
MVVRPRALPPETDTTSADAITYLGPRCTLSKDSAMKDWRHVGAAEATDRLKLHCEDQLLLEG